MQIKMFMMETGKIIKLKVKVFILTSKVLNMRVNGKMTNSMDLVLRNLPTEPDMRETTQILVNQERVNTIGQMAQIMMANGLKTRSMDWVSICGQMVENIMEVGQKVR